MIRALIYTSAFLLIANVVVALWPDQANYAPHIYSEKPELNPHFLRLNKEIEDRFYAQPALAQELPDVDQQDFFDTEQFVANCYRVGPFMHRSNYELAQAVLLNASVEYQKSKRVSKESNVYRVYLGPYASAAEVADVRVDLKRAKILDHFVRKESDSVYIVSLGIYTTKETAMSAVQLFDGKLSDVRMKDEQVILPDSYWLHFSVEDDDRIKSQLAQMDWGEQSAIMGKHQCL